MKEAIKKAFQYQAVRLITILAIVPLFLIVINLLNYVAMVPYFIFYLFNYFFG